MYIRGMKTIWFTWPFNDQVFFYPLYNSNDQIIGTQIFSDPDEKKNEFLIELPNYESSDFPIKTELV